MIYTISNPSDPYTIEPQDFLHGAIAVLLLGNGAYGMDPVSDGERLPIFLFSGAREWTDEKVGNLDEWLKQPNNARAIADALDTVLIGHPSDREELHAALTAMPSEVAKAEYLSDWKERRRSSMNNIGARAEELSKILRKLAAAAEQIHNEEAF